MLLKTIQLSNLITVDEDNVLIYVIVSLRRIIKGHFWHPFGVWIPGQYHIELATPYSLVLLFELVLMGNLVIGLVKEVFWLLNLNVIGHLDAWFIEVFGVGRLSSFQLFVCFFIILLVLRLFDRLSLYVYIFWLEWGFWPVELSAVAVEGLKNFHIVEANGHCFHEIYSKLWDALSTFLKGSSSVEQFVEVVVSDIDALRDLFILVAFPKEATLSKTRIDIHWRSKEV